MRDLYDYENASFEECIDDLNEVAEELADDVYSDDYVGSAEALERRGIRIQNIAERLKELESND